MLLEPCSFRQGRQRSPQGRPGLANQCSRAGEKRILKKRQNRFQESIGAPLNDFQEISKSHLWAQGRNSIALAATRRTISKIRASRAGESAAGPPGALA